MDDVERLLKGTVEELDRLLNARNVLGAPIDLADLDQRYPGQRAAFERAAER